MNNENRKSSMPVINTAHKNGEQSIPFVFYVLFHIESSFIDSYSHLTWNSQSLPRHFSNFTIYRSFNIFLVSVYIFGNFIHSIFFVIYRIEFSWAHSKIIVTAIGYERQDDFVLVFIHKKNRNRMGWNGMENTLHIHTAYRDAQHNNKMFE